MWEAVQLLFSGFYGSLRNLSISASNGATFRVGKLGCGSCVAHVAGHASLA